MQEGIFVMSIFYMLYSFLGGLLYGVYNFKADNNNADADSCGSFVRKNENH